MHPVSDGKAVIEYSQPSDVPDSLDKARGRRAGVRAEPVEALQKDKLVRNPIDQNTKEIAVNVPIVSFHCTLMWIEERETGSTRGETEVARRRGPR